MRSLFSAARVGSAGLTSAPSENSRRLPEIVTPPNSGELDFRSTCTGGLDCEEDGSCSVFVRTGESEVFSCAAVYNGQIEPRSASIVAGATKLSQFIIFLSESAC